MGITIHYRGTLDDSGDVETFEDAVIAAVAAIGGKPRIWRSYADDNPARMIRGVMATIAEGVETLSLLVSPEGHLIPLMQIEEAEQTPFDEPPPCSIKTQFGTPLSHVAAVSLLEAIGRRFVTDLSINDEGRYAETHDFDELVRRMDRLNSNIETMADALSQHPLSSEAAEDPDIVASRIERVAKLIHQQMNSSATERSAPIEETDNWAEPDLEHEVEWFEQQRRENQLRQERLARRIDEAIAEGKSTADALQQALEDQGLGKPTGEPLDGEEIETEETEDWRSSLPSNPWSQDDDPVNQPKHPGVVQAEQLLLRISDLTSQRETRDEFLHIAISGAMECVGGLVQATCDLSDDRINRALSIVQLRRALRGQAHVRGAVFALRGQGTIDETTATELHEQLDGLLEHTHELMSNAWNDAP